MREIIRPGNTGIKIKYNNTCLFCGCEYTYEQEDVFSNYNSTFGSYVLCPCCGKENIAAVLPNFINEITIDCQEFNYDKEWRNSNNE